MTGSNPHNGVDLNVGVGTYVYAPYDGWVEHISINAQQTDDINFVVDANDIKSNVYQTNVTTGEYTSATIDSVSSNVTLNLC